MQSLRDETFMRNCQELQKKASVYSAMFFVDGPTEESKFNEIQLKQRSQIFNFLRVLCNQLLAAVTLVKPSSLDDSCHTDDENVPLPSLLPSLLVSMTATLCLMAHQFDINDASHVTTTTTTDNTERPSYLEYLDAGNNINMPVILLLLLSLLSLLLLL